MYKIGQKVEEFELKAYHNNDFTTFRLSSFKGKWLVMVFYPADFTFVCPTELEELAAHYGEFREMGAEVVSVSTDTQYVHKAWHDVSPAIKKIEYPMLADPTGNLCRAFGTYIEEAGLSLRGSFVLDPNGVLKAFEIHDNSIGRSASELLRKVQAAKYVADHGGAEVCPANWKPGRDTLKPGINLVGKI